MVKCAALGAGAVVATVMGELFGLAAVALIEPSAEGGRAAREDAPHGPVMVGVELVPVGTGVVFPMPAEEVCEVQGHGCGCQRGVALAVGEGVEGVAAFGLADLGEVKVNHHFLERAVAEVGGDLSNGGAAFEHVGAETVAQGVGGDVLVLF